MDYSDRSAFVRLVGDLDKSVESLIEANDGLPVDRVEAARARARSLGITEEAFEHWLSLHTITGPGAGDPWPATRRATVRADLDFLASHAEDAARYRTLWSMLGLMPTVQIEAIRERHRALTEVTPLTRGDRIAECRRRLLDIVANHILVPGGAENYTASVIADALDLIADDLRTLRGLVGVLLWRDHLQPLAKRILETGWDITPRQAAQAIRSCLEAGGVALPEVRGIYADRSLPHWDSDAVWLWIRYEASKVIEPYRIERCRTIRAWRPEIERERSLPRETIKVEQGLVIEQALQKFGREQVDGLTFASGGTIFRIGPVVTTRRIHQPPMPEQPRGLFRRRDRIDLSVAAPSVNVSRVWPVETLGMLDPIPLRSDQVLGEYHRNDVPKVASVLEHVRNSSNPSGFMDARALEEWLAALATSPAGIDWVGFHDVGEPVVPLLLDEQELPGGDQIVAIRQQPASGTSSLSFRRADEKEAPGVRTLSTSGLPGCSVSSLDGVRFDIVELVRPSRRKPEPSMRRGLTVTITYRIAHDIAPGTMTLHSRAESWYVNPAGGVFHNPAVRGGTWPVSLISGDEQYVIAVYNSLNEDPDYPGSQTLRSIAVVSVRRYTDIASNSDLAPLSWHQLCQAAQSTWQSKVESRGPHNGNPAVELVDAYIRTTDLTQV